MSGPPDPRVAGEERQGFAYDVKPAPNNLARTNRRDSPVRFALTVNEDLKNRVTYSVLMQKMAPDSLSDFVRAELDKVALAHSTFTDDALALIVRSSEGVLRRVKNLCLGALLDAVRDRTKVVDLKQVNQSIACSCGPIGGEKTKCRSSVAVAVPRSSKPHGRPNRRRACPCVSAC